MDRCINNVIPQREKRRQVGLEDAAAQFLRRRANAIDGAQDVFHQFIDVPGAAIGQFPLANDQTPSSGFSSGA